MRSSPEAWPEQPIAVSQREEIAPWVEKLGCDCGGALETKLQAVASTPDGFLDFLTLGCLSCQAEHQVVFALPSLN